MIGNLITNILSGGKIVIPPYQYSTEYQTYMAAVLAAGGTLPDTDLKKIQEDAFFRALKSEGVWDAADQIFLLSTKGSSAAALINAKNPGVKNGTLVASPTFVSGEGFTFNGTTQYIRTNYIPNTDGVNLVQDDVGVWFYTPTSEAASGTKVEFGGAGAALIHGLLVSLFVTGSNINTRVHAATGFNAGATGSDGFYHFRRTSSTAVAAYRNGVLAGTASITSTGKTTVEIYIGAYNNNGTAAGFTTKKAGFWAIGKSVSGAEFSMPAHYQDYVVTPQDVTSVDFSDYTSYTNDAANFLTGAALLSATITSPTLSQRFLPGTLTGSLKYQGGALADNGKIFCAPSSAQNMLIINTNDDTYQQLSIPELSAGTFKYGGICWVPSIRCVVCCPQHAKSFLWVNVDTLAYGFFDQNGTTTSDTDGALVATGKFYGIYVGEDGRLYNIPYQSKEVCVVNPSNFSMQFFDTTGTVTYNNGNLSDAQKWDGGIPYGQYIYGSPSDATDMLKIDTRNRTCSRIGTFPAGSAKWAIAAVGSDGFGYFFPYFRNDILKINFSNDSTSQFGTIGSIDSNIKIASACVMPDGRILATGCDQSTSWILSSGNSLASIGRSYSALGNSKFIGGCLARNGKKYSVPFTGDRIMVEYYAGKRMTLDNDFVLNRTGRYS